MTNTDNGTRRDDDAEAIAEILGTPTLPREGKIKAILDYFAPGAAPVAEISSRATVAEVEAFGLTIRLDVAGMATLVELPAGTEIL